MHAPLDREQLDPHTALADLATQVKSWDCPAHLLMTRPASPLFHAGQLAEAHCSFNPSLR